MTKNFFPSLSLLLVVFLFAASGVPAALVSTNDPIHGPHSITRDTDTGLEWLDLTRSWGRSFNDVREQMGPNGEFEGFRHATEAELKQLFNNARFYGTIFIRLDAVTVFQGLFGARSLNSGMITTSSTGMFDDSGTGTSPTRVGSAHVRILDLGGTLFRYMAQAGTLSDQYDRDERMATVGHFLVRQAYRSRPTHLNLTQSSDTGTSNSDNITRDDTPRITGHSPDGTTVSILADGVEVGRGASSGTFAITTSALVDGDRVITAIAHYPGGESSPASDALNITIDTQIPAAPTGLDLTDSSDDGQSNTDGVTSVSALTIVGNAEPGTTVRLFANGVAVGADPSDGTFRIQTIPLEPGSYTLTAAATDVAGNLSADSAELQLTIVRPDFTVTVQAAPGQPFIVRGGPARFTATFNRAAFGFDAGDVTFGGTAQPSGASVNEIAPMDGTTWSLMVTGMVRSGSVTASIPPGGTVDQFGNPNRGSTSQGPRIIWEPIPVIPANLITLDDPVHGRRSITRDTLTGLEWLDVTNTFNRSYDDVSRRFGPGGEFEGFRHATGQELLTFWANAGIRPATSFSDDTLMQHFQSLVGSAYVRVSGLPSPSHIITSSGLFDDSDVGSQSALVGLGSAQIRQQIFMPPLTLLFEDNTRKDHQGGSLGHWLVRAASPPRLKITRSGPGFILAWDRVHDGVVLYQCDDLSSGNWVPTSPEWVHTSGRTVTAVVPASKDACFFELRLQ